MKWLPGTGSMYHEDGQTIARFTLRERDLE